MAHRNVDTAVRARLAAGFTACPIYPEGETRLPADGGPFIVVQFPYASSEQASAGSPGANLYREEGAVRFVLSVPRNRDSIAMGRQWAEDLANLFRGARFEDVRTFAPTSPVTDDGNDAGGFYVLAWAVPYQYDVRG